MQTRSLEPAGWLAVAAALAGLASPAWAQYKVVAPDGRVTYTDRPPADANLRVAPLGRGAPADAAAQDPLPAALRQTAARFPVTLYSSADCPPCEAGRKLLLQRGVPFTEKLILGDDDAAALQRTLGSRTVPTLTIGTQALRGLSESEWASYLDLAGYPRESQLPKGWQPAAATPLTARQSLRPASAPAAEADAAPAPAPSVTLPSGLRF